jgi:preprotein translocase subunit SecA
MDIFEKATRAGLRFEYRGSISVEDLWELHLQALNEIYKGLKSQAKNREDGLIEVRSVADGVLDLKMEIVKHIFDIKVAEREESKAKADRKERKAKLLEVLAKKQDQALDSLPVDQLEKMINDLD